MTLPIAKPVRNAFVSREPRMPMMPGTPVNAGQALRYVAPHGMGEISKPPVGAGPRRYIGVGEQKMSKLPRVKGMP